MRQCVLIISVFLLLLAWIPGEAQHKHKMKPYFKGRYKDIKIPRNKLKYVCPGYTGGGYPYQGLGVKLGDPFAVTYKLYLSPRIAIAMDYGRTATGLYNKFHRDNFEEAQEPDTLGTGEAVRYFGHTGKKDGIFSGKIVFSSPIRKITGLQWYVGLGAQYRWNSIEYSYIREAPSVPNELRLFELANNTLGPSGVIGIEFSSPDVPLSSFFEIEGYYDTWNFPGWIRISAGVGLRYIF